MGTGDIAGKHTRCQTKRGGVGKSDRLLFIRKGRHRKYRPEQLGLGRWCGNTVAINDPWRVVEPFTQVEIEQKVARGVTLFLIIHGPDCIAM